jgi:hypothetical protein
LQDIAASRQRQEQLLGVLHDKEEAHMEQAAPEEQEAPKEQLGEEDDGEEEGLG